MNETTAWIVERLPSDETLERQQMIELATALGRERRLWERLVRHDPGERYFVQLYRDVNVDVWLICWLSHQETGFHDHDVSAGAVYVCDGTLLEDRLRVDADGVHEATIERPAGTVFDFDAAYIHRIRHPGGVPATSVHVYSPALWRMGYYEPDAQKTLCRLSITYADEMLGRPR